MDRFLVFSKISPPNQTIYLVHKEWGQARVVARMDCPVVVAGQISPIGLFLKMPPGLIGTIRILRRLSDILVPVW